MIYLVSIKTPYWSKFPMQKNFLNSTIIFRDDISSLLKATVTVTVAIICIWLFLAQEGSVKERSEIFWERSENGDEQKGNGTVTVSERKNYCIIQNWCQT